MTSNSAPSPLCRCRVLYIGSAVPTVTKDGLQGIQQPLKERYPAHESPEAKGIDSWLSVWYNGLLLEYVDGERKTESAFFPINSLHYCAAVRYVNVTGFAVEGGGERFIPLDAPFAQIPDSPHPPIFAAIFRRQTGVKVLECHAFVCTNEKAANALVRCCFHAYADTMYLKAEDKVLPATVGLKAIKESGAAAGSRSATPNSELNLSEQENGGLLDGPADWGDRAIGQRAWQRRQQNGEYDSSSIASSVLKKGAQRGREGVLVPFEQHWLGGRRAASHSELRNRGPQLEFHDQLGPTFRRPPPAGYFYGGGMPPPGATFLASPPAFLRPPPPFPARPHPSPHFLPPHRIGPLPPPPHFGPGRMAPFPPFPGPPFFFMPPPFMVPHPPHGFRPKSPERTGSGPIITESTYDTFPRQQSRGTYEEPIYMPSSNGAAIPPQASYKPGSFSPELYEHFYETYKQQRAPGERKQVVSRSNSDVSGDYWEGYDASTFRKAQHANERAFAQTLAEEGSKRPAGGGTPKMNGSSPKRGIGEDLTRASRPNGQGTSKEATKGGEPRPPDTPPADYEEARGNRTEMAAH